MVSVTVMTRDGSSFSGGDAGRAEQQLKAWVAQAAEKAQRYERMQAEVAAVSVTESVAGGAVRVTVASGGEVTDLQLGDPVRQWSPAEIAAQILGCMRGAQGRLAGRVGEVMAATVGDDDETARAVVESYRRRFGDDEQARRPVHPDDGEDFSDHSYLR